MTIYSIDGVVPVVHPSAYVHPSATLIGDVIVGARCYIGPSASLRGDFGRLVIGDGANVQDCCVLHGFPEGDMILEQDAHIGHGAILHGCRIEKNAMVGMNAVVMDNAVIGVEAMVGAHAFVSAGTIVVPRALMVGAPAKMVRLLSASEVEWKTRGTRMYQQLAVRSLESMRETAPLTEIEPNRQRLKVISQDHFSALKVMSKE